MAFKVRRQRRKWKLEQAGFLPYESHALSAMPSMSVPYFRRMISERRGLLAHAVNEGWTKRQYEDYIKELYEDNRWKITVGAVSRAKSVGVHDPWAMLRQKRDEFMRDFPDAYQPPPGKRRGKARELDEEKLEKGRKKKYKGDVTSQRLRSRDRAREKRALESELAEIPGTPIYSSTGELLGRQVEYKGRVFTVRKDGTIL